MLFKKCNQCEFAAYLSGKLESHICERGMELIRVADLIAAADIQGISVQSCAMCGTRDGVDKSSGHDNHASSSYSATFCVRAHQ